MLAANIPIFIHRLKVTEQPSSLRTITDNLVSVISFPISKRDSSGGLIMARNFVVEIERERNASTYMPGPLTMSPLLTALSIWAVVSPSICLIDACCCGVE